jgi:hypothetical protein
MKRTNEDTQPLPEITVKGHKISPRINKSGVFSASLDDGESVTSETLKGLRMALGEQLEQAKKQERQRIECYYQDSYTKLHPAVFLGRHKSNTYSPFMFEIALGKTVDRKNFSESQIRERVFSRALDLKEYARLIAASEAADKALEQFLKANAFDPTKATK